MLAARKAAEDRAAAFRARRDELVAKRKLDEERRAETARLEAQRAALQADMETARLAKEQPFEYLRKVGRNADDLLQEGLKQGDPVRKLTAQIEAMNRRIEEREREAAKVQEQWQRQAAQERINAYESQFAQLVDARADDFPTLSDYDPAYVRSRAAAVAREFAQAEGYAPPHENVLYYLESELQRERRERQARRGKSGKPAGKGSASENGDGSNGAPVETLTSAQAPGPARSPAAMTPAERRKLASAQIARLQRGE